ncbi:hypothetical protein D4765_04640 [Subtercola vilae]|uniref:Uncharacterized protein n=1 Tax=Subtercola vilae TaxID=2056433 RepID=A0A4T2C6X0_9MICO|nr:hypothetical protein D4765_04640 [Subtercola vilae]
MTVYVCVNSGHGNSSEVLPEGGTSAYGAAWASGVSTPTKALVAPALFHPSETIGEDAVPPAGPAPTTGQVTEGDADHEVKTGAAELLVAATVEPGASGAVPAFVAVVAVEGAAVEGAAVDDAAVEAGAVDASADGALVGSRVTGDRVSESTTSTATTTTTAAPMMMTFFTRSA